MSKYGNGTTPMEFFGKRIPKMEKFISKEIEREKANPKGQPRGQPRPPVPHHLGGDERDANQGERGEGEEERENTNEGRRRRTGKRMGEREINTLSQTVCVCVKERGKERENCMEKERERERDLQYRFRDPSTKSDQGRLRICWMTVPVTSFRTHSMIRRDDVRSTAIAEYLFKFSRDSLNFQINLFYIVEVLM